MAAIALSLMSPIGSASAQSWGGPDYGYRHRDYASGLAMVGYITLAISTERPLRLVITIIELLVLAGIGPFMLKLATYPVKLALSQQAENERLRTRINLMNSVETCLIRLEDLCGEAKDIAAEDIANEQEFDHWNVRSN